MPTLRALFGDGALNLEPWDSEKYLSKVPKRLSTVFRTFETEAGTTHIVENVESGPAFGWRSFCTARCGVSAFAEPEAQNAPIESDEESVICGRCQRLGEGYVR